MVTENITDGTRLAELLSSEIHGRDSGALGTLAVVDADREVEPHVDGSFAYAVARDGERLADVNVHPDRIHLDVAHAPDTAAEVAKEHGLRVRPKAVEPPRTLVFIANGAEVKRATDVLAALAEA